MRRFPRWEEYDVITQSEMRDIETEIWMLLHWCTREHKYICWQFYILPVYYRYIYMKSLPFVERWDRRSMVE